MELSDVNHIYTWEPEDSDRVIQAELHTFGATEAAALETGCVHFLCLLTMAEIEHPLEGVFQVRYGSG